jgi:phage gp29-like protein
MSILDRVRGMLSSPADRAIRAMVDGDDGPRAKSVPTGSRIATPPRRGWSRGIDTALDGDPAKAVRTFAEAETGRMSGLIDLYKSTIAIDGRLRITVAKRAKALSGKRLVWKAPPGFENDPTAKKNAEMVARCWNATKGTQSFIEQMADAFIVSHAGAEKVWAVDEGTGWFKPSPRWIHPNRFGWNDALRPVFCENANGTWPGVPLDDYPDRFFFFAPVGGVSDYPWRRGALRPRVIPSMLKRLGARGWIAMLERWGQPQVYAKSDDGDNSEDLIEALRNLGLDWRMVVPRDVDIQQIPVSVSEELHKKFIDSMNVEDAIAILGQNLTTEAQGGSFAAAMAHVRVGVEILLSDAAELAEFLTDQYAEPIIRFNAPGTPVPYAEFTLPPPREWTVTEWQADIIPLDAYLQSAGHEPDSSGLGSLRFSQLRAALGASGGGDGTPGPKPGPAPVEPPKPSDTGEPGPSQS